MGKEQSKEKAEVRNTEIQESSSGFHILEIHLPTVGLGFTSIVLFAVAFGLCFCIYRRVAKRYARRPPRQQPAFLPSHAAPWSPDLRTPTVIYYVNDAADRPPPAASGAA